MPSEGARDRGNVATAAHYFAATSQASGRRYVLTMRSLGTSWPMPGTRRTFTGTLFFFSVSPTLHGVLRDAVVLAGQEIDAAHLALLLVERLGDVAAPVLLARPEDEPLGPRRLVLQTDLHRDEGALAEADEHVAAALDATLVLCTERLDRARR